jgi:hypothetical protein
MALYACLMSCQWSVMISNVLIFQFPDGARHFSSFCHAMGGLEDFLDGFLPTRIRTDSSNCANWVIVQQWFALGC